MKTAQRPRQLPRAAVCQEHHLQVEPGGPGGLRAQRFGGAEAAQGRRNPRAGGASGASEPRFPRVFVVVPIGARRDPRDKQTAIDGNAEESAFFLVLDMAVLRPGSDSCGSGFNTRQGV